MLFKILNNLVKYNDIRHILAAICHTWQMSWTTLVSTIPKVRLKSKGQKQQNRQQQQQLQQQHRQQQLHNITRGLYFR